jgi:hypothetical protein
MPENFGYQELITGNGKNITKKLKKYMHKVTEIKKTRLCVYSKCTSELPLVTFTGTQAMNWANGAMCSHICCPDCDRQYFLKHIHKGSSGTYFKF